MRMIGKVIILLCCFLPVSVYADYEGPTKLIVGYNSQNPPFSYEDDHYQPTGFIIDVMNIIAENKGLEVIYKQLKERRLIEQLENGQVDMVLGIKYSSTLEDHVDFTDSIFSLSDSLFVPKDNNSVFSLADLNELVVSLSSSSASVETLDNIHGVKVNVAGSQPDAIEMFLMERSDAYIGNPWTTKFLLHELGIKDRFDERIASIQSYDLTIAVSKKHIGLLPLLNSELSSLKENKTFQEIHNKWFYSYQIDEPWLQKLAVVLGVAVLIAVIINLISFLWNQRLKKEVANKTTALTRSFLFQEQVLNSVEAGIISFNKIGNIRLMNERARSLLQGDYIDQNIKDMEYLCDIWTIIETDLISGKYSGEWNAPGKNGGDRIIHYDVAPLKNENLESVGWIIVFVDVTEQKSLQQKLMIQEKLKALGQLTAGIAHELRNPLTSMKLFIELLPVKIHDQRFRDELLKHVPAEINRLNHLVEDLLDYTRRKEMLKEWIPLKEFLESLLYSFKVNSRSHQVVFVLDIDEGIEWFGDKQRIKQVFINLLMNAVEAVQETEEKIITITSSKESEHYCVSIKDTGLGISKIDQKNLFQPFFTTKGNGVGLGLYTSYNILREHQAEIELQSKKGVGSIFILKIRKEDIR